MDNVEILTQTLNSTIQRHTRTVQNYEVEIANLTAEIVRLQAQVSDLEGAKEAAAKTPENKPK
jgi:uncharacterized small protein (DUF1192 family)